MVMGEPKSEKSRRSVAVPQFVLEALKGNRASTGRVQGLVFQTANGTPFSERNMERHFHAVLNKAGLPRIRFHDLRHTAATLLLIEGVHPKVVQEMLGHSQIGLTMDTYSHVIPSMQKDAAEKMQNLFNKV
jgi:integrase